MRDIKFRGWDKERKYFIADSGVFINGIGSIYVQDMHYGTINKIDDDSIDIMLYIGLTDIKNKKIYEGDILQCNNVKYEVRWSSNGMFVLMVDNMEVGMLCEYTMDKFEIVGNIYENPELLS